MRARVCVVSVCRAKSAPRITARMHGVSVHSLVGRSVPFHAAAVRRHEGYGPTPLPRETAVPQADKLRSAELLQQQQDEATRELRSASAATTKQLIERTRELERLSKENEDVTAQVRQRLSAAFALGYSGRT